MFFLKNLRFFSRPECVLLFVATILVALLYGTSLIRHDGSTVGKRYALIEGTQKLTAKLLPNRSFEHLDKLDQHQAWGVFYEYLTEPQYKCQEERRMGKPIPKDGGWTICLDVHINPDNCYAYSFGIGHDWSFDDDMAEFGCNVTRLTPPLVSPTINIPKRCGFTTCAYGARIVTT
ncbi:uncharacterized protein LOC102802505 [Saccoglossus kowalevskii]